MLIPYDLYHQPFTIRAIMFAAELGKRGHDVTVYFRPMAKDKVGAPVRQDLPPGFAAHATHFAGRPWHPESNFAEVRDAIRGADVVHFQKSLPPTAWLAMGLARYFDKPLHQDWDDVELEFWIQAARDAWTQTGANALTRTLRAARALLAGAATGTTEWLIPKVADTLGGASIALRKRAVAWGTSSSRVFSASVGVDTELFRPDLRDEALRARLGLTGPTVLYAGSLDLVPDLRFFVEALGELVRQVPEAQCLVLGGGFGRPRLVELVERAGLTRHVVMSAGLVPYAEMPRYIASCDLGALPFRDTMVNRAKSSLTLLEYMAGGLPVVTHDVGDMPWMLGDAGEIAPPGDPRAFGDKLAALARDPARRSALAAKARARVASRFTWAKTVDHLEAAYYTALGERPPLTPTVEAEPTATGRAKGGSRALPVVP